MGERVTKLTSKQDGSPFWSVELDGDRWRILANDDVGLFWAQIPDEPSLDAQEVVRRWRAGEYDDDEYGVA